MKTTPCKGCGKPIVFVADEDGKTIPIDPRPPVYYATVWAADVSDIRGTPVQVRRVKEAFVSHFATCPKASEFSRKGKA